MKKIVLVGVLLATVALTGLATRSDAQTDRPGDPRPSLEQTSLDRVINVADLPTPSSSPGGEVVAPANDLPQFQAGGSVPQTTATDHAAGPGDAVSTGGLAASSPPTLDYFGAARDPSGVQLCIWLVGEYARDVPGASGMHDWGTNIAKARYGSGC